jgi:HSP90 family molecular chaperone
LQSLCILTRKLVYENGLSVKILKIIFQVFIRELVSNASDALEKRRSVEMKAGTESGQQSVPYELKIETDPKNKKLVFTDTGIGMSKEELVELLGTIGFIRIIFFCFL